MAGLSATEVEGVATGGREACSEVVVVVAVALGASAAGATAVCGVWGAYYELCQYQYDIVRCGTAYCQPACPPGIDQAASDRQSFDLGRGTSHMRS